VAVVVLGLFIGIAAAYGSWHGRATSTERVLSYVIGVPVATCLVALCLVVLFRFSITQHIPFRHLALGAIMGALTTMGLVIGVALFGSYISHYEQIYGTLTGIIVAMLGIYTMMYAILLCAVFNAEWRPLDPEEATGAVEPAAGAEPAAG
ncbi:MAG: YhjD/YihY/BrkB family envelope integrity protein, partial [Candidatus Nanopelagicales bacterium]